MNYFKAVCKAMQRQGQRLPWDGIAVHEMQQDEELYRMEWESNDRFDSVNIGYLNFDNVKSVVFTKTSVKY